MDHMVAGLGLLENRVAFHISPQCIKDMPVSCVIPGAVLVAAVPNYANRAWDGSGGHPGEDSRLGLQTVAHSDGIAPGIASISRELDKDIAVVGIANIDRSVRRRFHREEEVSLARPRDIMRSVSYRRQTRGRRNTH